MRRHCEQFDEQAINFNGDDRIILFQDLDGDQVYTHGQDLALDWIGQLGVPPEDKPWSDLVLLRSNTSKPEPDTDGSLQFDSYTLEQSHEVFWTVPSP